MGLEKILVIAYCDDFVSMREFAEPGVEVPDRFAPPAEEGEVAGMQQEIARWNDQAAMQLMSIRNADNPHPINRLSSDYGG